MRYINYIDLIIWHPNKLAFVRRIYSSNEKEMAGAGMWYSIMNLLHFPNEAWVKYTGSSNFDEMMVLNILGTLQFKPSQI